jgi:hypothetical protein
MSGGEDTLSLGAVERGPAGKRRRRSLAHKSSAQPRGSSGQSSLLWSWVLRQRGRGGLSNELSSTLVAAGEVLLSPQLKPSEVKAICRAAAGRLYQLPASERSEICGHLEVLERLVPLLARVGRGFSTLSLASRRKCIQACERSMLPLMSHGHSKLRHLVLMAYMSCNEAWPAREPLPAAATQVA